MLALVHNEDSMATVAEALEKDAAQVWTSWL